ncbi:hypothetical protein MKX03_017103 [Papaver bracteatum]|nr:hypothetical protein MKX03_017103 [Papaver bracteatum]
MTTLPFFIYTRGISEDIFISLFSFSLLTLSLSVVEKMFLGFHSFFVDCNNNSFYSSK